jgi:G3E family GTPase
MKTPIDIISGFLGAGKTTLLNEMLASTYKGLKVAIVENEFGDVNIDSALLPKDISIKELSSGCACCTMRVDLILGLEELISMNRFDRIVIEPTGVAKLSDMLSVLNSDNLNHIAQKGFVITVVNPVFHSKYSGVLGDYYKNQIEHTDIVYITRIDKTSNEVLSNVVADIKLINNVDIVKHLPPNLLNLNETVNHDISDENEHGENCCRHEHKHDLEHEEHHEGADSLFSSYLVEYKDIILKQDISNLIEEIINASKGEVLRIKGSLTCDKGFFFIQWVPDELNIEKTHSSNNFLVVIESNKK